MNFSGIPWARAQVVDGDLYDSNLLTDLGPEIEITDRSIKYLRKVLNPDLPTPLTDQEFADLWEEGRALYRDAQECLRKDGFQIASAYGWELAGDEMPPCGDAAVDAAATLEAIGDVAIEGKTDANAATDEIMALDEINAIRQGLIADDAVARTFSLAATPQISGLRLIIIIIGCIGVPQRFANVMFAVLDEAGLVNGLTAAVRTGSKSKIAGALLKILKYTLTKDFARKLNRRLSKKVVGEIIAKIAGRFLPFVGWAVMIACIIAAIL